MLPNHVSHDYIVFIGIACMMTFLSTVFVFLRFFARRISLSIGKDDWACLIALVFAYGFFITTVVVATVGHAGYHMVLYDPLQLETYLQVGPRFLFFFYFRCVVLPPIMISRLFNATADRSRK
jgi:hypothetical protein